jgi:NTP pyrophosphatase (non-canonical NTP hydrolase)
MNMPLNDLKELTKRTWHTEPKKPFKVEDVEMLYACVCDAGELGELFNLIKKLFRAEYYTVGHSKEITIEELEDELADVLYYIGRIAERLGLDLDRAMERKMKINMDRYGPAPTSEV